MFFFATRLADLSDWGCLGFRGFRVFRVLSGLSGTLQLKAPSPKAETPNSKTLHPTRPEA